MMLDIQQKELLFFFCGWSFLIYIIYWAYSQYYLKKYIEVTAVVTDIQSYLSRSNGKGRRIRVYNPEFTYQWKEWTRTVRPRAYASYWKYEIGDQVTIYVDPKDPGNIWYPYLTKKLFGSLWFFGAFAILVRLF